MTYLFLLLPLIFGYVFVHYLVPRIVRSAWFARLHDRTLNRLGLLGCGLLYLGIWGQIYAGFEQPLFLSLYCPGCALLAFSLLRAYDKGAQGGIILNTAFTVLTFLPFLF